MIICGGDVVQYNEIMKMSIDDYLIKLDNWVSGIEVKLESNGNRTNNRSV